MSEHFRRLENMYHSAPVNEFYKPRLEVGKGRAVLHMEVNDNFFHAANALHGSVYFKALDDAAFFAVNSLIEDFFVVTVSFNIYLLRPVHGGVLRAEGKVTSMTQSLFIADAELYVNENSMVARGSGQFMRSKVRLDDVEAYR